MASCLTGNANLLHELFLKQRSILGLDASSHQSYFSESRLGGYDDDFVSSDLESLAAKDEKHLDFLSDMLKAKKNIKSVMRAFLKEEAEQERRVQRPLELYGVEIRVFIPIALLRRKLEDRTFLFKLWLDRIQFTRNEDKKKYNILQDFELAIHEAQVIIKQYKDFLDKLSNVNRDKREQQQMLSQFEDRLQKALSKTFEEKKKAQFEISQEDVVRFHCSSARLCSLLGLQLDFLDRLEGIPPEDRDHLTLCEWIVTFLNNNYESVSLSDKNCLSKELLADIGFDPQSSAVEIILARAGNTQQHIEPCEIAKIFIEDQFKYNPLLSPLADRFPLQSNLTNAWFQLPSIVDEEGKESNDDLSHINIINLVTKEWRASKSMLNDLVSEDERNIVLFHGTDHQSAADILFRGIDLREGRPKRDFSCGKGFYLTNSFEDALNWAKSTSSKPSILVFQVNRQQYLDDAQKLNLYENDERWREIVSSFRSRKRTAKTRKSLKDFQLIEGPLATVRRSESEELVIEPKPSSYQMCLISDDFAGEFRQTLHSIMFLDMS